MKSIFIARNEILNYLINNSIYLMKKLRIFSGNFERKIFTLNNHKASAIKILMIIILKMSGTKSKCLSKREMHVSYASGLNALLLIFRLLVRTVDNFYIQSYRTDKDFSLWYKSLKDTLA